jgi:cytochrome P450
VIDQVKSLPETRVSIDANNHRRFFGQYTLMGTKSPELLLAVKQDLHRNVSNLLTEMMEETRKTTDSLISISPQTPTKSLPVYESMLKYITLVTGRTIVGLPLSRNEAWVSSAINYAIESMKAGHQLRTYPVALRPWVAPFLSAVGRLKTHQSRITAMLHEIVVQQRLNLGGSTKVDETQGRLASWLIQYYRSTSSEKISERNLCKDHILALFAGIHIATNAVTQVLLDLAARPEYQKSLVEEMESTRSGTEDENLSLAMIAKMSKLDSFIKESLRVNPPGGVGESICNIRSPMNLHH